ncbi:hypothetical protein [Pontibacillus salipaludis]|uniref:Uncharacterized protein n=1 Tax=Pontibacillus salipaludis TaxID=1697394 RepID=A0ABQ1QBV5_9BACI|nr:hypothetical protein [Pontibacillus salipaludis]GGD20278.1 hypothetical protein GCM10011389_29900 [Pontibacillus salipaludis]
MSKVIQKFFIFLAIVFVTFQPILVPAVYAVESWSGDSWEGNSWEGNPWNSSELQWSGEIWEGKSTNGETWNGEGTNGNGFQGEYFNGAYWTSVPWYLEGWNAEGWNQAGFNGSGSQGTPWTNPAINGYGSTQGTPWQANGFNGGLTQGDPYVQAGFDGLGTQGDPYAQAGFDGLGTQGNPYAQPGFLDNGTQGAPYAQPGLGLYGYGTSAPGSSSPFMYGPFSTVGGATTNEDPMNAKLPFEYDATKFVVNDIMMGQAGMMYDLANYQEGSSIRATPSGFYKNILINGVKLTAGDNSYVKTAANAYDTAAHAKGGYDAFQTFRDVKKIENFRNADLASRSRTLSGVSQTALNISNGAVSKFNIAAAGIGAGFSAIETGFNTAKAIDVYNSDASNSEKITATTDATASLGDTLMNAGMVATAIPGAQAAGLGIAAAGAVLWLGSKGVKLVSSNWKGGPIRTAKEIGRKAKDSIVNAYNKVKGWFS